MAARTAAHSAGLTVLDSLCPSGVPVEAALVAWLLDMPEADVTRLCDELDVAGYLSSAPEPMS